MLAELPLPLTKNEAAEAKECVMPLLLDVIKNVTETEEGYLLDFGRDGEDLLLLGQLLRIERVLNPFLRICLIMESNEGPLRLGLEGPRGTKDFLKMEYGLNRWGF